ncbi:hypothetical protein ZIOFF_020049 [Zingiber officinale]|uniref:Brix domain-containing protein n=1 Tax=Zingiber officinale TaxID=94328 RepID=A0A8J5H889_ZINOF|nr:hypothetical protein ZIOFF_020049 [Zingiber officinale]
MQKKRRGLVKPPVVKNQPSVDQITGQKTSQELCLFKRKAARPSQAIGTGSSKAYAPSHISKIKVCLLELQEKKQNKLKDFLNVAGPMGVTHFLMLSYPKSIPHLRVARTPQGPTLTFEVQEYSLAADIARSQSQPSYPKELCDNSPLMVLSGFGGGDHHLKLTTIMFQNIFPAIDISTVTYFRHYSIRLQPVGVSRRIRKFVQKHAIPDLRNLKDVSEFVTR